MTDSEQAGVLLFAAATIGPFIAAWRLAGTEARQNLAGVELFLAGAVGAVLGSIALFVAGFLYFVVLDASLSGNSSGAIGMIAVLLLAAAWFGYLGGLTFVLRKMGRRRAAGIVLLTPLVVYALITGLYAMLLRLGMTWARDFAGPSIFVLPAILPAAGGLWLLIRHRREEAGGYGAPATGPHQGGGTQD